MYLFKYILHDTTTKLSRIINALNIHIQYLNVFYKVIYFILISFILHRNAFEVFNNLKIDRSTNKNKKNSTD